MLCYVCLPDVVEAGDGGGPRGHRLLLGVSHEDSDKGWRTTEGTSMGVVQARASLQSVFHCLRLFYVQRTRRQQLGITILQMTHVND